MELTNFREIRRDHELDHTRFLGLHAETVAKLACLAAGTGSRYRHLAKNRIPVAIISAREPDTEASMKKAVL